MKSEKFQEDETTGKRYRGFVKITQRQKASAGKIDNCTLQANVKKRQVSRARTSHFFNDSNSTKLHITV